MFDLNEAIDNWRAALKAQPNFLDSDQEELEDHLREEINVLKVSGLSEEEAFFIASHRLGKPEDLNDEFAIADPERRRSFRLSWMITGGLAMAFLWLAAEVMTNFGAGALGRISGVPPIPFGPLGLGWFSGLIRLVLLMLGGLFIWRLLATDKSARRLKGLNGGAVALGAFLLVTLALATRLGSERFMFSGLQISEISTIAMVGAWFQWLMMLIFPVVLLLGLWRLLRS